MTIKLMGFVGGGGSTPRTFPKQITPPSSPTFREMVSNTEAALGLRESPTLDRSSLKALIKEEYLKMAEEAKKKQPAIEKKLEKIRKEYFEEMMMRTREMGGFSPALEKRIQLRTVSELVEIPVNELMLHFLNNVKHTNERHLIEYRLGHVYFYAS